MKKIVILLFGVLFYSTIASAQYSVNKEKYDYRLYTYNSRDPYSPAFAGVASFCFPGIGQMMSDEFSRGMLFFAGAVGFSTMYIIGDKMEKDGHDATLLIWASVIGEFAIGIWAMVDAVKVAKVNNMAYRDQKKIAMNFRVEPFMATTSAMNSRSSVSTGLSLKVSF
jgi:hypothetical protein